MNKPDGSKCIKCGRCCLGHVWDSKKRHGVVDDNPCQFLCAKTMACTVFDKRFEVNPGCLTVRRAMQMGVLPDDCPCVADVDGYKSLMKYEEVGKQ
jgi:uncharacterized cysteine cluster protein YcgN (CxxCxxCC family)